MQCKKRKIGKINIHNIPFDDEKDYLSAIESLLLVFLKFNFTYRTIEHP